MSTHNKNLQTLRFLILSLFCHLFLLVVAVGLVQWTSNRTLQQVGYQPKSLPVELIGNSKSSNAADRRADDSSADESTAKKTSHRHKSKKRSSAPVVVAEDSSDHLEEKEVSDSGPAASGQSTGLPSEGSPGFESLKGAYIAGIVKRVNELKRYPREALLREQEGRVMIYLEILPSGTIQEAKVESASPFESLNRAALETVRGLNPLPPLPFQVAGTLHVHIPMTYNLADSR